MGLVALLVRFGWSNEQPTTVGTQPPVIAWSTNLTPLHAFWTSSQTQQEVKPFADVPKNHWAYNDIMNLKREGVIVGYPHEIRN